MTCAVKTLYRALACPAPPLRVKIRSITGDETILPAPTATNKPGKPAKLRRTK